jgi:5-enolpyruvylshikimate-3-phosphate synthase
MTAIIAGLVCDTPLSIDDTACVAISYPSFESDLKSLLK